MVLSLQHWIRFSNVDRLKYCNLIGDKLVIYNSSLLRNEMLTETFIFRTIFPNFTALIPSTSDILKRYDSLDNTDYAFRQDDLYQRIMREAMLAAPTLSSSHLDLPNFDELYTEGDDEFRDYCEGVMSYRRQGEDGSTKSQHRRSYMLATKQISSGEKYSYSTPSLIKLYFLMF